MARRSLREWLLWASGLLLGAGLGAVLGSLTGSKVFGLVAGFFLIVGLALSLAWLVMNSREDAFQNSPALALVFEGSGTPCVHDYESALEVIPVGTTLIHLPGAAGVSGIGFGVVGRGAPEVDTLVRLHVKNLRRRRLKLVRVRVMDARRVDDGRRAYEYLTAPLKWMHDDYGSRNRSLDGGVVEPGDDESAYLDFATKSHSNTDFMVLEFAQPHLRQVPLRAVPTYVRLQATAADEDTGIAAPTCDTAFLIDVTEDGSLTVVAKTLADCGFK